MSAAFEDTAESWPVVSTDEQLSNWLITVRTDKVRMPDDHYAERSLVTHLGAVAVLALDDAERRCLLSLLRKMLDTPEPDASTDAGAAGHEPTG